MLYGPVNTNNVFRGFGGACERNNGDAVVRYDQLADRWLIVMPIFRATRPARRDQPPAEPVGRRYSAFQASRDNPVRRLPVAPPPEPAAPAHRRLRPAQGAPGSRPTG